ncbi:hypothetical protein [Aneurinibacillus aneurinilyticus]|nr:hypothetical protein [Aneurinibacillus aneurinilyticus]MED0709345.1 hypothetical protein [Aneurinibacillus aneurinilyticus]MED0723960.1 hypothetical protein [Aneurinibacillus aneurinilyticus]MED0735069.1 hypothetical protein [Aneurinibacillus aneurinilyticus]MED0743552.1 hypothetical protein [Aneurinibacillus aneurinilyticus]
MKKKYNVNRRKELQAINQQISGIKSTLHKIEDSMTEIKDNREKVESILHEIQGYVSEAKGNREKLENIMAELAEVKQHLAKKSNRQPRKRRNKGETEVQTEVKTSKKDGFLGDLLGNMDFAQIMNLLQSPLVQSMLKNFL